MHYISSGTTVNTVQLHAQTNGLIYALIYLYNRRFIMKCTFSSKMNFDSNKNRSSQYPTQCKKTFFRACFDPQNATFIIFLFKNICSDFKVAHLLDQIGCKLIFFVGGCLYRILNKRIYQSPINNLHAMIAIFNCIERFSVT